MSTPSDSAPRKSSAASRYLMMLVLGLVLGAVATVMLLRSLEARKTPMDKWHGAVMNVIAVHNGQLKKSIETNRCNPNDVVPHLQTLRRMADDLEPAFPDLAREELFVKNASEFRHVLDAAQASPPLSCESLKQTASDIGTQCKACHDNFRKS
ncbi:hypothetical protein [Luteimonas sp. e5]